MTDALTLSDLLTRRLSLQWYEGIAIVRGVTERLLGSQTAGMRIPELHQIELTADGSVAVVDGISAKEPVRRLGQLLQAMLTDVEVPVQLRLVVSQATAPTPAYGSLAEFDQALAYFERPDRAGLLIALFARAVAAGPMKAGDTAVTLDGLAPLPEAKEAAMLAASRPTSSRRAFGIGVALTVAVAGSTAATLYLRNAGTPVNGHEVSRVTVAAADTMGAVVMAGVSAVSDRMGLGRLVDPNAPITAPAIRPPLPLAPRPKRKPVRQVAAAGPVMSSAAEGPRRVTAVAYDLADDVVAEILSRSASTREHVADEPTGAEIYASDSEGVSPPVGLGSQLPQALSPTVELAKLSRIELIIAPDGTVESARLLDNRPDVLGGMFLSAVKAWEFQPATKDGVAVRYRKTILVSFE